MDPEFERHMDELLDQVLACVDHVSPPEAASACVGAAMGMLLSMPQECRRKMIRSMIKALQRTADISDFELAKERMH